MTTEELESLFAAEHPYCNKGRWVTIEEGHILNQITIDFKPEYIFESGTANGFSTLWLSLYGAPVFTFDPVNRYKMWGCIEESLTNITYVQETFKMLPISYPDFSESKKLFFLDGLHTASGLKEDYDTVMSYASAGDTVLFHDLNINACSRAYHRMQKHAIEHEGYDTDRTIGRIVLNG